MDPRRAAEIKIATCTCGAQVALSQNRLGKYLLTRRIAAGGMGEIFHGKLAGIEGFERQVAIKKLLPHLTADRNFIDMMIKEAKLTVALNHPAIVQVYDLAKEGDEYYFAMEYIDGINVGTLLDITRRRRQLLPLDLVLHIVLNVLRGLQYAHDLRDPSGQSMGILHRDITPQNILVTREGFVKITDFGIAKARNEISTTRPGMIKGKLGYIAPEQLSDAPLDQRVDLFCVGILMWEALACRRLFKGQTEIDSFRLVAAAVVPPLADVRDDIPPRLESVIHQALARLPDDRFASAGDYYDALCTAIFPRTPDDCAATAIAYYADNGFIFVRAGEQENDRTVEVEGGAKPADITSLLLTEPKQSANPRRWLLALLAAAAAAGVWLWTQPRSAPVLELPVADVVMVNDEEALLLLKAALPAMETACYSAKAVRELRKLSSLRATLVFAANGAVAEVSLDPQVGAKLLKCISDNLRRVTLRPLGQPKLLVGVELMLPAKPVETHTPIPPPAKLSAQEILAVVRRSGASACLDKLDTGPRKVGARIVINTRGRVQDASATSIDSPAARDCLLKALRRLRFRRQPQPNFAVTIPFELARRGDGT